MGGTSEQYNLDVLDVTKFLLSFLVAAIHVCPVGYEYKQYIFPWARMAVPLFFMITSFLFFRKYRLLDSKQSREAALKKTVLRNLRLYAFWFVVLLPATLARKHYFESGPMDGAVRIIQDFFFGETFFASWYIMASIIGILILVALSLVMPNWALVTCGAILYTLCLLATSYRTLASPDTTLYTLIHAYPGSLFNGFPAGIMWLAIGKSFADFQGTHPKSRLAPWHFLALAFSLALLLLEHICTVKLGWYDHVKNDCYIMLVPTCTLVFLLALHAKVKTDKAKEMRAFSTITYCLHASLGYAFKTWLVPSLGLDASKLLVPFSLFMSVMALCMLATVLILRLEKHKRFSLLRFAH